jgi:hypothetical protein
VLVAPPHRRSRGAGLGHPRQRCPGLALAAHVRNLDDLALNDLLVELPVDRFDALLEAAFGPEGVAA